jgi:hypothetical protein
MRDGQVYSALGTTGMISKIIQKQIMVNISLINY